MVTSFVKRYRKYHFVRSSGIEKLFLLSGTLGRKFKSFITYEKLAKPVLIDKAKLQMKLYFVNKSTKMKIV